MFQHKEKYHIYITHNTYRGMLLEAGRHPGNESIIQMPGIRIFIITSNIPVDMKAYEEASAFRKKEICRNTLAKACGHPEIAGKITNCLAFRELSTDALTDIVSKFIVEELQNYEIKLEHIDEQLMVQLKKQHSNYGARGVKDAVREAITAATVYDRNIDRYCGKKVVLSGNIEDICITIVPEDENAG